MVAEAQICSPHSARHAREQPDPEDCCDPGLEHHSRDEDVEPVMQGLVPGHGFEFGVDRVDPVQPGDAEEEDDHVDRDPGGKDRAPTADGFVFAFDDPVRNGLAEEEPEEVATCLSEEDGEPCLAVAEYADADRAHEQVDGHAGKAEAWPERHGTQEHPERLEGDGNSQRCGGDRDVRADDDEECHQRHRRKAPEQLIVCTVACDAFRL